MFPGAGERVPADETTSVFARVRRMRQACRLLCRHFGVMSASGCKPGRPGAGGRPPHHGSAQGEFKNRRKSRSRRGYEAEVFFVPKSASLRRRLPFLNSPSGLRERIGSLPPKSAGKRTAAVCGAPAAAAPRGRACWDHFTAFGHSGVLRLVLRTQPRSGASVKQLSHLGRRKKKVTLRVTWKMRPVCVSAPPRHR